jgi:hypothetical protein
LPYFVIIQYRWANSKEALDPLINASTGRRSRFQLEVTIKSGTIKNDVAMDDYLHSLLCEGGEFKSEPEFGFYTLYSVKFSLPYLKLGKYESKGQDLY